MIPAMPPESTTPLSPDELREKYRLEREKRLRPEGNAQYVEPDTVLDDFDRDPYVEPGFTRDPVSDEVDVTIIGAGFGGMLAAANLRKAGIDSFRMIDKAGDFGGTWYWNRYPGAACDVESHVYLPMLEETGYMPTEKYVKAPEIFAYCQRLGRHFDLYPTALFQTDVEGLNWDDATSRWTVTTDRADRITSRFVIIAGGVLHKAKLPGIPGIDTFAGHAFHTARWDYAYTGGSPTEPLSGLADKRVGIIGTGATAVQAVPHLARSAKELFVFQRTPAPVGVRANEPTDPEWFASLPAGWQEERIRNFVAVMAGEEPDVDMVNDGWTQMLYKNTRRKPSSPEEAAELERIDFENMETVRQRIASVIDDPETAERLKPWYGKLCKRLCFHDEYLQAFNQPNVHLVDTEGKGVERITPDGVVVGGVEYPVDCLVYASGFEVTSAYSHRLGFDPHGRGGVPLSEAWAEGPATLHGVLTRGFPNMLMISPVQGGQNINFLFTISATARHVVWIVDECLRSEITEVEPTVEAQEAWWEVILSGIDQTWRYQLTCTPGYLNNEGGGDMRAARAAAYMGSAIAYADELVSWRDAGDLPGLECHRGG
jgi:cation diffusion facilitator CzcD-associated flavoprotein CzcO